MLDKSDTGVSDLSDILYRNGSKKYKKGGGNEMVP